MCCKEGTSGCSGARGGETPCQAAVCTLRRERIGRQTSLIQGEEQWWREGKAACALCGDLPEDSSLFSFYGVLDMNFRSSWTEEADNQEGDPANISRYPELQCTAPALPRLPLPVLLTQPEQGRTAVLLGAVQAPAAAILTRFAFPN